MCAVKTPKIQQPEPDKPLPLLRNPLLDGIDPTTNALRIGRQKLRIDRTRGSVPASMAPSGLRIGASG